MKLIIWLLQVHYLSTPLQSISGNTSAKANIHMRVQLQLVYFTQNENQEIKQLKMENLITPEVMLPIRRKHKSITKFVKNTLQMLFGVTTADELETIENKMRKLKTPKS